MADTESDVKGLLKRQLKSLESTIVNKPPYCQGTLPLPNSDFTLFYGKEANSHRVNLSTAPLAQLQHLATTCAPATFGVDQQDVLDETYRKAGKLDKTDFMIGFDIHRSGLLDIVRTELLDENRLKNDGVRAELYKLNVYGKDSFFKPHVDTPHSELMFGSLVIVFPTPHEGGALKLRERGRGEDDVEEWTFDSAALLSQQREASVAYVAFFSDTEHEVMPVRSGFRVTITYNLYYVDDPTTALPAANPIPTNEEPFRTALKALLDDPAFLPEGGNLMFGLKHQYPLATSYPDAAAGQQAVQDLAGRLKASDAVILKVLRQFSLDASLKVVYQTKESEYSKRSILVMADGVLDLPKEGMIMCPLWEYLQSEGGQLLKRPKFSFKEIKVTDVHWVSGVPKENRFKAGVQTYGNEPTMSVVYWHIWLFVRIGPAGTRDDENLLKL